MNKMFTFVFKDGNIHIFMIALMGLLVWAAGREAETHRNIIKSEEAQYMTVRFIPEEVKILQDQMKTLEVKLDKLCVELGYTKGEL